MSRTIIGILILGVMLLGFVFLKSQLLADETEDSSQILRKLDEALTNQSEILKQLTEVKEELRIIKVRVTRYR